MNRFASDHSRNASLTGGVVVLTLSDTRTLENDTGGALAIELATAAGHRLIDRLILKEEPQLIAETVGQCAGNVEVDAILITGGTGIARRDRTCETIAQLLTQEIPGYGELFRYLSFKEIGPAAMLSRAQAGLIEDTFVLTMPGSPGAVRLAMEQLILPELSHLLEERRR